MNVRRLIYFGGAGGAAIAATVAGLALAGHSPAHAASQPVQAVQAAAVQPAASTSEQETAGDTDTVNDSTTPDTTTPEPAGAAESATASDGPGGHEDNPADANAAHDFQGNE
jgi:hypothetical protein